MAVLSYPLYKALLCRVKSPWKASLLATVAVMLIILVPLLFVFNMLANEAYGMYVSLTMWSAFLISAMMWLLYSIVHKDKPLIVNSILWVIFGVAVVVEIFIYGGIL